MNPVGDGVDEFFDDATAKESPAGIKNKLDIENPIDVEPNDSRGETYLARKSDILADHGRGAFHQKITGAQSTHA